MFGTIFRYMFGDIFCVAWRQNLAELEQRWENEKEEIRQGALTNNEVFFIDYHLQEVSRFRSPCYSLFITYSVFIYIMSLY